MLVTVETGASMLAVAFVSIRNICSMRLMPSFGIWLNGGKSNTEAAAASLAEHNAINGFSETESKMQLGTHRDLFRQTGIIAWLRISVSVMDVAMMGACKKTSMIAQVGHSQHTLWFFMLEFPGNNFLMSHFVPGDVGLKKASKFVFS